MATRILLMRHGQSVWNAVGRWQGQADPPLSELGREQAKAAAANVGSVDAIVSSDPDRAAETAAIIATELGVDELATEKSFRERDAGEWSGLTREEIEERWPGYLAEHRRPKGWEPDDKLLVRVLAGIDKVAKKHEDATVLVVTHGGVVYTLEAHLGAEHGYLANVAGRWLVVEPGPEITLGERVVLLEGGTVELTTPKVI
jgi:broad specificity phosphatase PhoE